MKTDEIIKYLKRNKTEFNFEKVLIAERNKYINNKCINSNYGISYEHSSDKGYIFKRSTSRPGVDTSNSLSLEFFITKDLKDLVISNIAYSHEDYPLSCLNNLKSFLVAVIEDSYVEYPSLEDANET